MSMLMSLGTRAMFAAYAQLNTIGHNIANVNTPGYSRQQTLQAATEGQFTGSGYFGRGVTVQTVTRATNMFLTQRAESARAGAAADGVRLDMLQQLEKVFGTGEAGVGHAATQLFNAFNDLAASPADLSARQAVLARGEDLASMMRSYSDQIDVVQANVRSDVENSVREVNTLADEVAGLNLRIIDAMGSGSTPNDLLDARDHLVSQIAEKIEVHTFTSSDGSMSLFVGGGQSLVLGGSANHLVAARNEYDPTRSSLGMLVGGQESPLDAGSLSGGSLAGLMAFQDDDLVEARNRLGQMAAGLAEAMNLQQSFGIDLTGATGADMFGIGDPVALPAASNDKVAGAFVASVDLAIVDATALKASEYTMVNDPANAGMFIVTRLADDKVFQPVASGDVIDGFSITVGAPPPGPSDRYLLKPSSAAASGMELTIGNPRAIAAAAPVTAVAAIANTGSASVASLTVVAAPAAAYQALTLNFIDNLGGYELRDAGNAVVDANTWTAGTPISYNGFELKLDGRPAQGDVFTLAPTAFPSASNGNALAFDGLAARLLVDGQSFTDAYAQTLSEVGVRVQGATAAADTSGAVASRASEALSSETGVNLDEEAAKLIQYQQAYQAAAKMLQTAQSVLDTLLSLGGR
ncbi:flagellar hook-associated protein FlgK [Ideonella sp. A 288]|uniref:flagellar hook-associated protein FlgK n=1 Tax=Ideonella sp. A 288 TaxID=1962181 RepID=UPI000B4BE2AB|nr:flagellar hook-associated protein FlgK [Ideonella sp. A 288]